MITKTLQISFNVGKQIIKMACDANVLENAFSLAGREHKACKRILV